MLVWRGLPSVPCPAWVFGPPVRRRCTSRKSEEPTGGRAAGVARARQRANELGGRGVKGVGAHAGGVDRPSCLPWGSSPAMPVEGGFLFVACRTFDVPVGGGCTGGFPDEPNGCTGCFSDERGWRCAPHEPPWVYLQGGSCWAAVFSPCVLVYYVPVGRRPPAVAPWMSLPGRKIRASNEDTRRWRYRAHRHV